MATEYNVGGARQVYGPRRDPGDFPDAAGSREVTYGNYVEVEYNFTYDNLPAWSATNVNDACIPVIPAYAVIKEATLLVTTPWAGGTSIEVGTFLASTGVAVDADGLIPAAVGVVANLNAAGEGVYGTGAQVVPPLTGDASTGIIAATQTTGAAAVVIGVVAVGTFTAGKAKLIVTYLKR